MWVLHAFLRTTRAWWPLLASTHPRGHMPYMNPNKRCTRDLLQRTCMDRNGSSSEGSRPKVVPESKAPGARKHPENPKISWRQRCKVRGLWKITSTTVVPHGCVLCDSPFALPWSGLRRNTNKEQSFHDHTPSKCSSIQGLMVSIRWHLGYLNG